MSFIRYILDVNQCVKRHPRKKSDRKYTYYRNMLYIYSQPQYFWGRCIDKIIRITDKIAYGN